MAAEPGAMVNSYAPAALGATRSDLGVPDGCPVVVPSHDNPPRVTPAVALSLSRARGGS